MRLYTSSEQLIECCLFTDASMKRPPVNSSHLRRLPVLLDLPVLLGGILR